MRNLFALISFLISANMLFGQVSHLSVIYDFEGEDFNHSVKAMVGVNDSLYVIGLTPDQKGVFFRIDANGNGYKEIWKFDAINYDPWSLAGNDSVIYGTTYSTPSLFKYSLRTHMFELVKHFDFHDVNEIQIKYITDSVLWFTSFSSTVDKGSIFTTNPDGSNLQKIYSFNSPDELHGPVDFTFHENRIYIACYGGGNLFSSFDTNVYSGGFARINIDGTGYENIIAGSNEIGTMAQSVVIHGDKLFGLFAESGNMGLGGRIFRCNLDGSSYEPLSSLNGYRALTRMLSTDSLIYGISMASIFGINPGTGEIRIFDDLLSNADFGADVVSNPAYLKGNVYITAQQGGPGGSGGTILKWLNENPEVNIPDTTATGSGRQKNTIHINLHELFTDPNADSITYRFLFNPNEITSTESNGILSLTPKTSGEGAMRVIATDGWTGYNGVRITLNPFTIIPDKMITAIDDQPIKRENKNFLYPNPASSTLKLTTANIQSIQILGIDGKSHGYFLNPADEINISYLKSGIYFFKIIIDEASHWQKIIKH